MAYDIHMGDIRTAGNVKLGTVYLPHYPDDADKIIRLRESMLVNGWIGRAVVLIDCGDRHQALSGSHRMAAAQGIDDIINAVILDDLTSAEYDLIDSECDDDGILAALETINADRGDDSLAAAVSAFKSECAANNL